MSLSERQTYNVEVLVGIKRPRIRQTPQRCVVVDLRLEGRVVVVAEDVHEIQVSGFWQSKPTFNVARAVISKSSHLFKDRIS